MLFRGEILKIHRYRLKVKDGKRYTMCILSIRKLVAILISDKVDFKMEYY